MKILLHGINFAPELTGVGKYTGEMAQWLAAHGHEVRVVTAPPYYPEWQVHDCYRAGRYSVETWQGARVWRCPLWVPTRPGSLKRLLHLASFAASSTPVMLRQIVWRPDVVWVVEPALFCAPAAWATARLAGTPCWLHVQDFEVDAAFQLELLGGATMRRAAAACERWLMRRFDCVSTISRSMLERAASRGVEPQRLLLAPNWVDMKALAPPKGPNPLRPELGIAAGDAVALYSGTMGKKQGLELLAAAAERLQGLLGLVFVFCGNGPGREQLETSCNHLPNVRFLDLQPPEHLGALLDMADIHLLPQQAGAADLVMPSKLTGMLASGRPVVATSAGGTEIARVVRERGVIVPPGDVDALVGAIRELAADDNMRARLGANARAYAERHLSRDVVLARFEKELCELVDRTG